MLQFYINQAHLFKYFSLFPFGLQSWFSTSSSSQKILSSTPRKTPHSAKEKKEKKKHDGEKRGKGSKLTTPLNLGSDQGTEKYAICFLLNSFFFQLTYQKNKQKRYPSPPSLPRSISSSEVKTSKSKPQRSSTSPKTPKGLKRTHYCQPIFSI